LILAPVIGGSSINILIPLLLIRSPLNAFETLIYSLNV